MEILKFDDAETSSSSPKRSGRGAILVTFVALVFGAGTALASGTLAINSGQGIELAQGVSQTVQCDSDGVNIALNSSLASDASTFYLGGISVTNIHDNCVGKNLRLKVYNTTGTAQVFCQEPGDTGCTTISGPATYVQGAVANTSPSTSNDNTLSFNFSNTLIISDSSTVKNVTIETIN
jgi:hypothetical protein